MILLSRSLVDMAARLDPSTSRVAARWMMRTAFNKENPADLLSQLVKVLERAAGESKDAEDTDGVRALSSAVDSVRDVSREVQSAWRHRSRR